MGAMAPPITSRTNVFSSFYTGADHRKHQSSASLAFVRGIQGWPVNSPHKGPVTRKMFPFDAVIMSYVTPSLEWISAFILWCLLVLDLLDPSSQSIFLPSYCFCKMLTNKKKWRHECPCLTAFTNPMQQSIFDSNSHKSNCRLPWYQYKIIDCYQIPTCANIWCCLVMQLEHRVRSMKHFGDSSVTRETCRA